MKRKIIISGLVSTILLICFAVAIIADMRIVDVRQFNGSLPDAIAASHGKKILISTPTTTLSAELTIPADIEIEMTRGGLISYGANTLIINGTFKADLSTHFTGSVGAQSFGLNAVEQNHPEWYGAAGDGSTDDYSALQSAISAYPAGNGTVFLMPKQYKTSQTLNIHQPGIRLMSLFPTKRANGWVSPTTILSSSTTATILAISPIGANVVEETYIKNIHFTRTSMGAGNSAGIAITGGTLFTTIDNVSITKSAILLYAENGGGLFLDKLFLAHAADLADHLYGVKIKNWNGIQCSKLLYYGGSSPSALDTTVFYAGAIDNGYPGGGDIRIDNFETSGSISNGIVLEQNTVADGFSSDVVMSTITMDAVTNCGIKNILNSGTPNYAQQMNITGAWINLTNPAYAASGINIVNHAFANIHQVTVAAAGATGQATGIYLQGAPYATISGCNFTGGVPYYRIIDANISGSNRSDYVSIIGNTAIVGGDLSLTASSYSSVIGNNLPNNVYLNASGSNYNRISDNLFSAYSNSGTQSNITTRATSTLSGVWAVGDRIINSAPSGGQPKSWVCTVAGNPATWVSEGDL